MTFPSRRGALRFTLPFFSMALLLAASAFASGWTREHAAVTSTVTISGTPAPLVQVGHMYTFQPVAHSPLGRTVRFSIRNHPGWSTFNTTTGLLSGSNSQTGTYTGILISATDGVTTATLPAFTIRVTNSPVSGGSGGTGGTGGTGGSGGSGGTGGTGGSGGSGGSTPTVTISGSPATAVVAGQSYSFQPAAMDSSGGAVSFSVQGKPSWATFSVATGQLSGTPTSANVGTSSNIVISASDGTASAALPAFSITVSAAQTAPPPAPPTIAGTPTTSVVAGQGYSFTPSTTDPSGKTLTFSVSNAPSWATFSTSTGKLSGTPSSANVGTSSNIVISVSDGTSAASLGAFTITVTAAATQVIAGAPLVLYTDVASGPNSGGENNNGAYLSIFGKNFGSTGLGSTVRVYVGSVEVSSYRYLGPSRGRPDIQQISVQVGALGSPTPGTALPVEVSVNGVASNTNQTFTVNPGRMLFVSLSGNDSTAVAGDITHPYRHVQNGSTGAFDVMKPGDTIVMRGTALASGAAITSDPTAASAAWTDVCTTSGCGGSYFLRTIYLNGTAPTGASGSGPLTLIGYPNEDVYIYESYASGALGAISGVDTTNYSGGRYVTIADLRIEAGGAAGVINEQIAGQSWRVVNNELTASTGTLDVYNLAGGITGNGTGTFWVGNHVHNINSASPGEMHGIYIDGDGSYEVSYNLIETITDGTGFQVYVDGSNGSTVANNVVFHHNMIYGTAKYGINIADGSSNGFVYYDNVVYNTSYGCLRFNTETLKGAKIYNNTFFNCSVNPAYGVVTNDWNFPSTALDMENNIFYASTGGAYSGGANGMSKGIGTITNNLFYNGTDSDNWDSHPITGNPDFLSTTAPNLGLATGSPAIGAGATAVSSVVTTDYTLAPRTTTSIDIGAYTH